jgi:hypothetical protein
VAARAAGVKGNFMSNDFLSANPTARRTLQTLCFGVGFGGEIPLGTPSGIAKNLAGSGLTAIGTDRYLL